MKGKHELTLRAQSHNIPVAFQATYQEMCRWPILDCSVSSILFRTACFKSLTVAEFITVTSSSKGRKLMDEIAYSCSLKPGTKFATKNTET